MSWFPVDDAFHSHPKARKAGLEAVGLWSVSGSYCMAYLTDGFVPDWFVKEKPRGTALAKRLVSASLWRIGVNAEGEPGFWFHEWKPECTKKHVLAAREKARQRKAKSRESHGESRVTDHVTDSVSPASCLVPTQPNPTQPINPLVNLGGEVTQVDASEPPPRCPKHLNHTGDVPPCPPCGDARKANKAWNEDDLARKRRTNSEAAKRKRDCEHCDENGLIFNEAGDASRCKIHEEAM